ncbi:hypothetical protein FGO68_gene6524 [Halteria grandinella]|uniref:Uncharacterized protein n=1 Tax=Halteria grandinella TaxID=5974 RepID=A0A8J8T4Q3_HALGN|nr:hypothetical protein FGO68_gene6524 [Halteria grandinella]
MNSSKNILINTDRSLQHYHQQMAQISGKDSRLEYASHQPSQAAGIGVDTYSRRTNATNKGGHENDSSLRMFLEELKNEEETSPNREYRGSSTDFHVRRESNGRAAIDQSSSSSVSPSPNRLRSNNAIGNLRVFQQYGAEPLSDRFTLHPISKSGTNNNSDHQQTFNGNPRVQPSGSINSSETKCNNLHDESLSKMQNEIAFLQSKIKGLENKLSPYNSASAHALKNNLDDIPRQMHPSFGSKQDESLLIFKSNGAGTTGDQNHFWMSRLEEANQGLRTSVTTDNSQMPSSYQQTQGIIPATFPLRLKGKQSQQVTQVFTGIGQNPAQHFQEKYDVINDSKYTPFRVGSETSFNLENKNKKMINSCSESPTRPESENEYPPAIIREERYKRNTENSSSSDSSTISVTENVRKRIIMKSKNKLSKRSGSSNLAPQQPEIIMQTTSIDKKQSRHQQRKRSLSASLKRPISKPSPTELPLKRDSSNAALSSQNGGKSQRQVRFSEIKERALSPSSSHSSGGGLRGAQSKQAQKVLYQDYLELKKANAYLKHENEQLKRKCAEIDEIQQKHTSMKQKYRKTKEALNNSEQLRKEQALENAQKVKALKKKTKFFKERLKQMCRLETTDEITQKENYAPCNIPATQQSIRKPSRQAPNSAVKLLKISEDPVRRKSIRAAKGIVKERSESRKKKGVSSHVQIVKQKK